MASGGFCPPPLPPPNSLSLIIISHSSCFESMPSFCKLLLGDSKLAVHDNDEEELSATPKSLSKEESAVYQIGGITKRTRTSPVPFFSGNPMVEHTAGILHLYKDEYVTC